jgi:O-antigen/teichoic acid export membrane protein
MNVGSLLRGHILWRGFAVATSFVTTIVLSRYLEAAMTGWFFYIIAWLTFFVLIASLGMDIAVTYTVSSGKFNGSSVFTAIILWIIFCIVVSGIAEWFTDIGVKKISAGTFTLFIAGQLLILFFSAYFFGEKKFILPSFVQVAGNLSFSLYCIFYFENSGRSAQGALHNIFLLYALFVFLQGVYLMCHFIFSHKKELRFQKPNNEQLKLLLSYSGMALLANIIFFLYQRADYWLIRYFGIGDAELGNYIQASRIAQMFQLLPAMIAGALFPILSSLKEKKEFLLLPLMRITLQLNIILLLTLALVGLYLFPFLFGPSFGGMYKSFLYLIPGILSLTVLSLLSAFFASENLVKINLFGAVLAMTILFTGDILLLKRYGISAAPIVNSVSAIASVTVSVIAFKRYFGKGLKNLFVPVKKDYSFVRKLFFYSKDVSGK